MKKQKVSISFLYQAFTILILEVPVFLAMTKFDLLSPKDQALLEKNIFYYHPESYGFFNDTFSPDVSKNFTEISHSLAAALVYNYRP